MIESFNDQRLQKRQRETGVYIKIARNTADIYIHIYICIYMCVCVCTVMIDYVFEGTAQKLEGNISF